MDVTLPDGTAVRASSISDRVAADPSRDFGLYMDARWDPSWPSELIDWPNFGLPSHPERAASQIRDAFARARDGQLVEVGCIGGLGRTGTVLACMTVLAGLDAPSAVAWVRQSYKPAAVETADQEQWVAWFSNWSRSEAA